MFINFSRDIISYLKSRNSPQICSLWFWPSCLVFFPCQLWKYQASPVFSTDKGNGIWPNTIMKYMYKKFNSCLSSAVSVGAKSSKILVGPRCLLLTKTQTKGSYALTEDRIRLLPAKQHWSVSTYCRQLHLVYLAIEQDTLVLLKYWTQQGSSWKSIFSQNNKGMYSSIRIFHCPQRFTGSKPL